MPKSTTCMFLGKVISVEDALIYKKSGRRGFTCEKCGQEVKSPQRKRPRQKEAGGSL